MGSKHIYLVTETFPPEVNGVARTLERFLLGLHGRGHRLSLVRPGKRNPGLPADVSLHDTASLPIPLYKELRLGITPPNQLRRWMRNDAVDAVYVATEGPLGLAARQAARGLGIRLVSGFHTNFHSYSQYYGAGLLMRPVLAYQRWFHGGADATLVPTDEQGQMLKQSGFGSTVTLSRGVDSTLFDPTRRNTQLRREWGLADDDVAVMYVGRLAAEKNIQLVADAYRSIRNIHPSARLILVGDGPKRRTLKRDHPEAVFCGMRHGEDLATHYASGDLFLFSSLTETFGNVVTEAMASGLTVVSYDYAAGRAHIRNGENGFLAPVGDNKAFIDCATAAAGQAAPGSPIRVAARQHALTVTWDSIITRLEQTLLQQADPSREGLTSTA